MSAGHPLSAASTLTLSDYLDCDHVVVNVAGGRQGAVDTRLGALGHARRASVAGPYHAFAADPSLAAAEAPEEIGTMSFAMAWHPRLDSDPAQQRLRDTIRAAAPE